MPESPQTQSIGVAMSGGVDSSVTACLLKEQGFAVRGFYMALAQPDLDSQIARVKKVARHLEVELEVIDLRMEFEKEVLDYFSQSYFSGQTPNPCVVCNRKIKFGLFMENILARGMDLMATGHYARITSQSRDGKTFCRLLKGVDPSKDQSYFLCLLRQEQLSRLRMPLGEYTKKEIYHLAADRGLSGLHGDESQDVCFLRDNDVGSFLSARADRIPTDGPITTEDGRELGRHSGIHHFTVGQRRGLGIADATPYYVLRLAPEDNLVVVGKKEDLYRQELQVREVNWLAGIIPQLPRQLEVKIRYRHRPAAAMVNVENPQQIKVSFLNPQRGITPGQFAVFYDDQEVVGGGVIA